jgi:pimeloyl-ACP methyl ester carboxylesterase
MAKKRTPSWFKRWWKLILTIYLLLLVGSHAFLVIRSDRERPGASEKNILEVDGQNLAYLEWGGTNNKKPPVILLHGSPSRGAMDFRKLGPELAQDGRRVIAVDRWGYGGSEPWVADYSFESDANAVLGLMDQLGIGTAHVAGCSYGGGPALVLGEEQPGRIRSVTMIGAIGVQKGEGSGNYVIEHAKYAVTMVAAVGLPEIIPHFGLLGPRAGRYAFARDFWDGDQRRMSWRLQKLDAPVLIIHGKRDFLVPAWVAQEHHALQPQSRLVVLDASHIFPLGVGHAENLPIVGKEMRGFMTAADTGKAARLAGVRNETSRGDLRAMWDDGPPLRGYKPWWLVVLAGMVFGLFVPRTGGVLAGLGGGWLVFDFTTAVLGVVLGAIMRRGESTRPRKALMVVCYAVGAGIPALLTLGFL